MKINVLTLFPSMYEGFINESIIGRAIKSKILEINIYNIRDYTTEKHGKVDDYTYGGGDGMLMQCQPICDTYKKVISESKTKNRLTIALSPRGKVFNDAMAVEFSKYDELTFICGHYEGIDERALLLTDSTLISIGDYVLTGGELPSMVIIDSVARKIDGVLGNATSKDNESFQGNLLEYPQYTRPEEYEGLKVPEVLISGDHKKVDEWRLKKQIEITKENRPDLYEKYLKDQNGGNL